MEAISDRPDQLPTQPDQLVLQKQRVEEATDFLSICDRLSTGYDSGYYWEDVQRALRIAAGLEKWPECFSKLNFQILKPISNRY